MTERSRRNFTPEEKAKILREQITEAKPVSEICERYEIHPTLFYRWQNEAMDNLAKTFERDKKNKWMQTHLEEKIVRLEKKLSQKNEVLSELMEEHVALKKSLGED
jgi:transposase-like protein